jgi:erythromycin esterase-like protein
MSRIADQHAGESLRNMDQGWEQVEGEPVEAGRNRERTMFARLLKTLATSALTTALVSCAPAQQGERRDSSQFSASEDRQAVALIRSAALPLTGTHADLDPLVAAASGATRILLGESTHGTHEYYAHRAQLTLRLIRELGVNAVGIEGDWTPTQRVNLYVRGLGNDRSADQALRGYTRFPAWMWPNRPFRDFVEQLRALNLTRPAEQRVGLYGMDVYDLYEAADQVQAYLKSSAPAAFKTARGNYRCFAPYNRNTHSYGVAAGNPARSCKEEAAAVLAIVRTLPAERTPAAAEAHFNAVRSADSVAAAEEYFRSTYAGANSWNIRDQRMARTVEEIAAHVERLSGQAGKVVMWSHNTHSGDARATSAAREGELNIGQLMKQQHGSRAVLVGYFSYAGSVFAASEWDQPGKIYQMREALPGSYSHLFHQVGVPAFVLPLPEGSAVARALNTARLERAIGVVYVPDRERRAHYFYANLSQQFDVAIFYDSSTAVQPL